MSTTKSHIASKKPKPTVVNPFVQMIEDKKKIDQAIEDGKSLSDLKNIKFVKPI